MYQELTFYKNRYGDCLVPKKWSENPLLNSWVQNLRTRYIVGKLSTDQIKCLESVGFVWDVDSEQWERMFTRLVSFEQEHGHCNVPLRWAEDQSLGVWVCNQRRLKAKGGKNLCEERIIRLNAIGFIWDYHTELWDKGFSELETYKAQHGNCLVPPTCEQFPELSKWVRRQRTTYARGKMSKVNNIRLNSLGFVWKSDDVAWESYFAELLTYKSAYGNCNVPNRYDENRALGSWVGAQRSRRKQGKLKRLRVEKLNGIGFVWDTLSASWEEMFSALVSHKAASGHCNVPQRCLDFPLLGQWVGAQRTRRKQGKILPDRILRLDEIGFIWDTIEAKWEEMLSILTKYQKQHGNCNVPQRFPENKQLGIWVSSQRLAKKKGRLTKERIQRLESIGFGWTQDRGSPI